MIKKIIDDVHKLEFEDLNEVIRAVNDRRNFLNSDSLGEFRVGDKVSWISGRGIDKREVTGEVYKINTKSLGIKEEGRNWHRWRVSPSLVTKIGE